MHVSSKLLEQINGTEPSIMMSDAPLLFLLTTSQNVCCERIRDEPLTDLSADKPPKYSLLPSCTFVPGGFGDPV